MSGIFDSIFGDGKEKQTVIASQPILSPVSTFAAPTGTGGYQGASYNGGTTLASSFNPLGASGLNTFGVNNAAQRGRVGNLIGRLGANENPFIQARVNPMRDEIARRRADLSRSIAQRGVSGSLGTNELLKFDSQANRELADQQALATNDALSSLMNAEGLAKGLNEDQLMLADNYFKRDATAMGLNLEALRLVLGGRGASSGGSTTTTSGGGDFGSTLTGIGSLLTGIGRL